MNYIIIGLGNYGSALAVKLTALGHEVIGADSNMNHIELIKDKVTHTVCIDCTDPQAIKTLPLQETDAVFIAIGEDFGASIMITALLKKMNIKKIICRAINPLHQNVLQAIGVDEIVFPEQDSADRVVRKLEMNNIIDSLDISDEYSIIETIVPEHYIGKTVKETDIRNKFNVNVMTIKRTVEFKNMLGMKQNKTMVTGVISPDDVFQKDDIVILFGRIEDIKKLL